jgi:hypothetical protein
VWLISIKVTTNLSVAFSKGLSIHSVRLSNDHLLPYRCNRVHLSRHSVRSEISWERQALSKIFSIALVRYFDLSRWRDCALSCDISLKMILYRMSKDTLRRMGRKAFAVGISSVSLTSFRQNRTNSISVLKDSTPQNKEGLAIESFSTWSVSSLRVSQFFVNLASLLTCWSDNFWPCLVSQHWNHPSTLKSIDNSFSRYNSARGRERDDFSSFSAES